MRYTLLPMDSSQADIPHYLLRIELKHVHRPVWRDVEVPAGIGLHWLHYVIQEAMGWQDYHLHEFVRHKRRYTDMRFEIDEWGPPSEDEAFYSLDDLLERVRQKLTYQYDFGDDWQHGVTLRKRISGFADFHIRCVGGEGACPLEDCGGVYGHEEVCAFLRGDLEEPDRNALLADWIPEGYDPDRCDLDEINRRLASIEQHARETGGIGPAGEHADMEDEALSPPPSFAASPPAQEVAALLRELESDGDEIQGLLGKIRALEEEEDPVEPVHPYEELALADLARFQEALEEGDLLRQVAPWKQLYDSDIFAIEDPESGRIDLVSILGKGGEVYALHVHQAPEGIDFWRRALLGQLPDTVDEYASLLRVNEIEFVNKTELEEPDLDLYELTSHPAPGRGRQRWMQFRRYRPRQPLWFLEPDGLPSLIRASRLTRHFMTLLEEASDELTFTFPNPVGNGGELPATLPGFRLPPDQSPENPGNWQFGTIPIDWDRYVVVPQPYEPTEFEVESIGSSPLVDETWETGAVFVSPVMTSAGPVRPIVAAVFTLVDDPEIPEPVFSVDPAVDGPQSAWQAFAQYSRARQALPTELRVTTDVAAQTFAPLEQFGVRIVRCDHFEGLNGFFAVLAHANRQ